MTDDSPGYYELNFSPSGEWAAYRFSAYRTGMTPVRWRRCSAQRASLAKRIAAAASKRRIAVRGHPRARQTRDSRANRARRRHRRRRRQTVVLGAAPRARQARFPPSRRLRARDLVMKFGIDRLLEEPRAAQAARRPARGAARASRLGDARPRAFARCAGARWTTCSSRAAFGPQHGLRGDKQDNMVESPDFTDPVHGIPVFSLYGEVRRPTRRDDGHASTCCSSICRTSAAASTPSSRRCATCSRRPRSSGKAVWVLDRPNPAGRPVEGLTLRPGWESFVGAGADADAPRPDAGRAGALVRRARCSSTSTARSSPMEGWEPGSRARATAGRSASAPG